MPLVAGSSAVMSARSVKEKGRIMFGLYPYDFPRAVEASKETRAPEAIILLISGCSAVKTSSNGFRFDV